MKEEGVMKRQMYPSPNLPLSGRDSDNLAEDRGELTRAAVEDITMAYP